MVALMSIDPEYAERLLTGEKRVEFRKKIFGERVTHVVIYASAPVQKVVGIFEVGEIDVASPTQLWERYKEVAGIARAKYRIYYRGCPVGVAIQARAVERFCHPLTLGEVDPDLVPPQSFRYLPNDVLDSLRQIGKPKLVTA